MPIYEYLCSDCNEQFELLQKVSDEAISDCPHCHEPNVKKLVSATSFRLKGSGWYETDFKDKKTSASSNSETKNKTSKPVSVKEKIKPTTKESTK